jgi:pimeloyl-ACP methyl ester carboxylesterase
VTSTESGILHYEVRGEGPVIVLLHGYLGSGEYWSTIRTALQKDHTVVTLDLLGFGKSPKPKTSSYNYSEQLSWIRRTLGQAHVSKPFLLVGHSMGSLLALRYSRTYPSSVSRLVLINLPLFTGQEQAHRELSNTNLLYKASMYWCLHHVIVPIARDKRIKAAIHHLAPSPYKGMEEYLFTSSGVARGRSLRNIIEAQTAFDDLEKLPTPTTIIAGRNERKTYVENVGNIRKRKNITVILADTKHHAPLEDSALIVKILQQK